MECIKQSFSLNSHPHKTTATIIYLACHMGCPAFLAVSDQELTLFSEGISNWYFQTGLPPVRNQGRMRGGWRRMESRRVRRRGWSGKVQRAARVARWSAFKTHMSTARGETQSKKATLSLNFTFSIINKAEIVHRWAKATSYWLMEALVCYCTFIYVVMLQTNGVMCCFQAVGFWGWNSNVKKPRLHTSIVRIVSSC